MLFQGFWCGLKEKYSHAVYMFDKVFASFSLLTRKNLHKQKYTSIDMHNLAIDTSYDLWRIKTHVNWHARNWNDTYY